MKKTTYYLMVVCSQCKTLIRTKPTSVKEHDEKVSHSLCDECAEILYGLKPKEEVG